MDLKITARGASDRGLTRSENQDAFLLDLERKLFIVCDGMGGHAGGEIASALCVQECSEYLDKHKIDESSNHPNPKLSTTLAQAVNSASMRIYEKALENPSLRGMGTTATLLKICGQHAYFAHVGDSRLYLLRAGFIYQLTKDHSLVSEQVAAGLISEEEAKHHQLRNVITRSVGYQEEELVDTSEIELEDEDLLLLCSDGLHGKAADEDIALLVKRYDIDAVDNLIDLANERGGEDNITVIAVKCSAASN